MATRFGDNGHALDLGLAGRPQNESAAAHDPDAAACHQKAHVGRAKRRDIGQVIALGRVEARHVGIGLAEQRTYLGLVGRLDGDDDNARSFL